MVERMHRETLLPGNEEKSMIMKRIYHTEIGEPLHWIALAVFQPARFQMTYEPGGFRQRSLMLARLIIPLFLLSWMLVMLVRFIPLPSHMLVWSDEAHGLPWSQWEVAAIGVTFGLVVGLLFGMIRGVSFGIVVSLTAGVVFGLPGVYGLLHTNVLGAWLVPAFGLAWGLAFGIIVGLAAGVGIAGPDLVADMVIGLGFGLAMGVREGIAVRLEISLVIGLIRYSPSP
jgi:hypothetical protein